MPLTLTITRNMSKHHVRIAGVDPTIHEVLTGMIDHQQRAAADYHRPDAQMTTIDWTR
jgi:hypothetical protein